MKSQRRHELSTNELADWVANIPEWWEQNGRVVIAVIVAVIVLGAIWYFTTVRTAASRGEQAQKLSGMLFALESYKLQMANNPASRAQFSGQMIMLAGQLKNFADTAANPNAGALALIKSAEAARAAGHYSSLPLDAEAEAKDLASARDSCLRAIALIKDDPSLLASAKLQLGLCQEGLGSFDEAKKTYHEIVDSSEFQGDVAVAQARLRLAVMDDYAAPVLLAPAPETPPAIMSATPVVTPQVPEVVTAVEGIATEPNLVAPPK